VFGRETWQTVANGPNPPTLANPAALATRRKVSVIVSCEGTQEATPQIGRGKMKGNELRVLRSPDAS
jgi:hypothetical protein